MPDAPKLIIAEAFEEAVQRHSASSVRDVKDAATVEVVATVLYSWRFYPPAAVGDGLRGASVRSRTAHDHAAVGADGGVGAWIAYLRSSWGLTELNSARWGTLSG